MRLKISHTTEYRYDVPVAYALQRLRLEPHETTSQKILSWGLEIEGAHEELRLIDPFGNRLRLISTTGQGHTIKIRAHGEIETKDNAGVFGRHREFVPLWLYQRETALTEIGDGIRKLAAAMTAEDDIDRFHDLMKTIASRVEYKTGATVTSTSAEAALANGAGVCQDHTHIFAATARAAGYPARYVSGYLKLDEVVDQVASHAWSEVYIPDLGWVGFDVSNGISPDERYVRLAVGRDYNDVMPVSGIRVGRANEHLDVHISVEQ
jgi:transglutaminase-like putative cysteine protease